MNPVFKTIFMWAAATVALSLCAPAVSAPTVATARARAVTLRPLSLLKTTDLSFGNIVPGKVAGSVTVDPISDAAVYANVTGAGGPIAAARFVAAGSANQLVYIRIGTAPSLLTRQGGGATMSIDTLRINAAVFIVGETAIRVIPADRTLDIRYGARLLVAANQQDGVYEGSFGVTVDYQ